MLPDPTPAELARAAEGDVDAFKLIVERYQGMVYSVAYNVLGNHTDAEDAAQEAFLRCSRKLPQFRGEATFCTWLFRLALTASVDYQRRERRRPEPLDVRDLAGDGGPELGEGMAPDPEGRYARAARGLPCRRYCATSTAAYQEIADLTGVRWAPSRSWSTAVARRCGCACTPSGRPDGLQLFPRTHHEFVDGGSATSRSPSCRST